MLVFGVFHDFGLLRSVQGGLCHKITTPVNIRVFNEAWGEMLNETVATSPRIARVRHRRGGVDSLAAG